MTPTPIAAPELTDGERVTAHMVASLLLTYPDDAYWDRLPDIERAVATLPTSLADCFARFLAEAAAMGDRALANHYVAIFDLKRRCCLYLSYFGAGDTRRRGMALVTFREAYRAAGWEFDDEELPDYLPAVLEFSARSRSPIAAQMLAAHRDGLEVLRTALGGASSPFSAVIEAVCRTLPPISDGERNRFRELLAEGPPTELVGTTFLGGLAPYSPRENANV